MNRDQHGVRYRGFTARVYYDEGEGVVLVRVPTTKGGIDFQCTSIAAVQLELHRVVDAFLTEHPDAEPPKVRP